MHRQTFPKYTPPAPCIALKKKLHNTVIHNSTDRLLNEFINLSTIHLIRCCASFSYLGHSCNSLIPSFPSKISTGRSKDMSSTALHDGINIRPWNPWKHVPYALNPHAPPHAPQKNENFDASTDMKVFW